MDRVESLVENTPLQLENCGVLAILTESLAKIKEGSEEVMIDGNWNLCMSYKSVICTYLHYCNLYLLLCFRTSNDPVQVTR